MGKRETALYCDHCKERYSHSSAVMDGSLARCPDCGSLMRFVDTAPSERPAIEAALADIEAALKNHKERLEHTQEEDVFVRGYYAGYTEGLKRAISAIRYEIGIRQDPPNISF
jgi:predicted  nucleic acid-binding Zn-ribbon protein